MVTVIKKEELTAEAIYTAFQGLPLDSRHHNLHLSFLGDENNIIYNVDIEVKQCWYHNDIDNRYYLDFNMGPLYDVEDLLRKIISICLQNVTKSNEIKFTTR